MRLSRISFNILILEAIPVAVSGSNLGKIVIANIKGSNMTLKKKMA
jgi:hypothetical protein